MFGYIKISKGELKIKEYDTYKAVYCSLCKRLGKNYGFFSRLTLSYDFTFLALLNMSLQEKCAGYKIGRCAFNPLKKCNYCNDTDFLEMPSAAATIMLYYKILDNVHDERGFKKLGCRIILPLYKRAYKKAKKTYPQIDLIVGEYINKQNELEKERIADIDTVCDPTATALAQILELCSENKTEKRILNRLGYCLGKYIYLSDALADREDDLKKGSYNVINILKDDDIDKRIERQIYYCINESISAFELLPVKRYKTILGNIIYLGLEDTYKREILNEQSV